MGFTLVHHSSRRNVQSLVIDGAALELVFPNSNDIFAEAQCPDADLEKSGTLRNCVLALANLCKVRYIGIDTYPVVNMHVGNKLCILI